MRWCSALSLALLLAVPATRGDDPPKAPTAAEELQRFQGTWQVEAWEEGGKAVPAADLKGRSAFFGGSVFIFRRGGETHQAGAAQLDPSKPARTINFAVREGEGKGGVMLGIYARDGDTLKLCYDPAGQDRPADFKPAADSGFAVVTLKKPKPPAGEEVEIAGKYRSVLTEPNGRVVATEAVVERRGDAYLVTYTLDGKVLFVGTALRKGDVLSMCWVSAGQAGVSQYRIEKGPKLVGEFTTLAGLGVTGKEVLTPWKQID